MSVHPRTSLGPALLLATPIAALALPLLVSLVLVLRRPSRWPRGLCLLLLCLGVVVDTALAMSCWVARV
jgi:hypothetical protein